MSNMLRGLARNRAKFNMRALGFHRICSDSKGIGSIFADEWRKHTNGVKFVNVNKKKAQKQTKEA